MRAWPVRLTAGEVTVRPLTYSDATAWRDARRRNVAWLARGTRPSRRARTPGPRRSARWCGACTDRRGGARHTPSPSMSTAASPARVTVNNVVRGSAQFASIGYWLDQRYAGRGVMPRAVALVVDHCFTTAGAAPHRGRDPPGEHQLAAGRGEARAAQVGYAPKYLHIDGDWRDHRLYAITREVPRPCSGGWKSQRSHR